MSIIHPPPKSSQDGSLLADSIREFALRHNPSIKYEGMKNAFDALTACRSPENVPYEFHYEIKKYTSDGVFIRRVDGKGHRTTTRQKEEIMVQSGHVIHHTSTTEKKADEKLTDRLPAKKKKQAKPEIHHRLVGLLVRLYQTSDIDGILVLKWMLNNNLQAEDVAELNKAVEVFVEALHKKGIH